MTGFIPVPPDPWVPTATDSETKLFPDATMDALDEHNDGRYATTEQGAKADSAYQLPEDGVPATDLASAVQTSLGKADTALQPADVGTMAAENAADYLTADQTNAAIVDQMGQAFGLFTPAAATQAALAAALSAARAVGGWVVVPAGMEISLTGAVNAAGVKRITGGGKLIQTANAPIFNIQGSLSGTYFPTTGVIDDSGRLRMGVSVAASTGLSVGDIVIVRADDAHPGEASGAPLAYMREVITAGPAKVTWDAELPRPMSTNVRLMKVTLAEPVTIDDIDLSHADPSSHTTPLVRAEFARDLVITASTRIHHGGHHGIQLNHVFGANIDATVYDLLDDEENNHYSYGLILAGTTRNVQGAFRTRAVRHGFTTNKGVNTTVASAIGECGEPETVDIDLTSEYCTNRPASTHPYGWNITIGVTDTGSVGGVDIRADNVIVKYVHKAGGVGAVIKAIRGVGYSMVVPPVIGPIVATSVKNLEGLLIADGVEINLTVMPEFIECTGSPLVCVNGGRAVGAGLEKIIAALETSSDITVNNSAVAVDVDELAFAVQAGFLYSFECVFRYSAATAADAKLVFDGPSMDLFEFGTGGLDSAASSASGSVYRSVRSGIGTAGVLGGAGAGNYVWAYPHGDIRPSADGTVTPQFAQSVANVSDAVLGERSRIRVLKRLLPV